MTRSGGLTAKNAIRTCSTGKDRICKMRKKDVQIRHYNSALRAKPGVSAATFKLFLRSKICKIYIFISKTFSKVFCLRGRKMCGSADFQNLKAKKFCHSNDFRVLGTGSNVRRFWSWDHKSMPIGTFFDRECAKRCRTFRKWKWKFCRFSFWEIAQKWQLSAPISPEGRHCGLNPVHARAPFQNGKLCCLTHSQHSEYPTLRVFLIYLETFLYVWKTLKVGYWDL